MKIKKNNNNNNKPMPFYFWTIFHVLIRQRALEMFPEKTYSFVKTFLESKGDERQQNIFFG